MAFLKLIGGLYPAILILRDVLDRLRASFGQVQQAVGNILYLSIESLQTPTKIIFSTRRHTFTSGNRRHQYLDLSGLLIANNSIST